MDVVNTSRPPGTAIGWLLGERDSHTMKKINSLRFESSGAGSLRVGERVGGRSNVAYVTRRFEYTGFSLPWEPKVQFEVFGHLLDAP